MVIKTIDQIGDVCNLVALISDQLVKDDTDNRAPMFGLRLPGVIE